jgi:hypothetical protein
MYWAITLSENIGYLINRDNQQSEIIGKLVLGCVCLILFIRFISCSFKDGMLEEKQFSNGVQNYEITRQIEKNSDDTFKSVCLWVGGFVLLGLVGGIVKKNKK